MARFTAERPLELKLGAKQRAEAEAEVAGAARGVV